MKKLFLIWSPSSSPAFCQHKKGITNLLRPKVHKGLLEIFDPPSLSIFFKFIVANRSKSISILMLSPGLSNIVVSIACKLLGFRCFFYLHEPFPVSFRFHSPVPSIRRLLISIFVSYFYNPICLLFSYGVVFPSLAADFISQSNGLVIIRFLFGVNSYCMPLVYPDALVLYANSEKLNQVAVVGSLNLDKGLDVLIRIALRNPSLNFSILSSLDSSGLAHYGHQLKAMANVELILHNSVSDDMIYKHIACSRYVFLGYKHITQSGILPIALGLSTVPILSDIPSHRINCFTYASSCAFIDLNTYEIRGLDPCSGNVAGLFKEYQLLRQSAAKTLAMMVE